MKKVDSVDFGSRGYYSLTVLDENGNPKQDKCLNNVNNAVTYEGAYKSLMAESSGASPLFDALYAAVGTGNSEITRSSTGLGNPTTPRSGSASSSRSDSTEVDNLDGTSTLTVTRVFSFGLGDVTGTFSEVGLYTSDTAGTFVAGQLIKDEFGNPTTITILPDEQLAVTYTLEWVIPNDSKLVGTGSVTDSSSNSYAYEIWAQPYFVDYPLNETRSMTAYFDRSLRDEWVFRDSSGTGALGGSIDTGSGWAGRVAHNGSGLVTATTDPYTFSPSSFSATGLVFAGAYTDANTSSRNHIVDTSKALRASGGDAAFYIKFLDPITKTSNDSFSIQVELEINV